MLILGQHFCLLGPIIFETPQPNWHYFWFWSRIIISIIIFVSGMHENELLVGSWDIHEVTQN